MSMIYESKINYYRIVRTTFSDRVDFNIEKKSKKSNWIWRIFGKDPYEWLQDYTISSLEQAKERVEWLIEWDNRQYDTTVPIRTEIM